MRNEHDFYLRQHSGHIVRDCWLELWGWCRRVGRITFKNKWICLLLFTENTRGNTWTSRLSVIILGTLLNFSCIPVPVTSTVVGRDFAFTGSDYGKYFKVDSINSGDPNNEDNSYYEPRTVNATFEPFDISYSEAGNRACCDDG